MLPLYVCSVETVLDYDAYTETTVAEFIDPDWGG